MWPFDDIGDAVGGPLQSAVTSSFEAVMRALWDASLLVLSTAFQLADQFTVFSVSTTQGPLRIVWPLTLWISAVLAMGLFSWQLIMTNLRGGRGFVRLITGPVQYGIALAVTVGVVAAFLAATEGLTLGILSAGLQSSNFTEALTHTSLRDATMDGVTAVVLGICALFGVIPAAIGYLLEMLFRQAAILVLVSVAPIAAAGLLAGVTAPWFWRTARWLLAAIAMQPVLALTLVIGVAAVGGAPGLAGLLAGVGVLVISLFTPFALFRLFAFVDPNSEVGAAFRDSLSSLGVDSYGWHNPALAVTSGRDGGGGGRQALEDAHTGRFDDAIADYAQDCLDDSHLGTPPAGHNDDPDTRQDPDSGGWPDSGGHDDGGGHHDPPHPHDDPPHPDDDGGGGGPRGRGPRGPRPGGGGGAGGAGAVEGVAVLP